MIPAPTPRHQLINGRWQIPMAELRAEKKAELAEARWQAEVSEVNGIRTDRESQALITGAALKAMQDSEYTCRWKTETGFVELTAAQILAIADAVRAHVQSCFDREAELLVLVDAATTPEELEGIKWSMELSSLSRSSTNSGITWRLF